MAARIGRVASATRSIGLGIYLLLDRRRDQRHLARRPRLAARRVRAVGGRSAGRVHERLDGVTVADVMDPQPVTIAAATTTVLEAQERVFLRYGWPLVRGRRRGRPLPRRASAARPSTRRARPGPARAGGRATLVAADADGRCASRTDQPLEALLGTEALRRLGALMAVDGEGVLRGVVTIEQVQRAIAPAARTGGS